MRGEASMVGGSRRSPHSLASFPERRIAGGAGSSLLAVAWKNARSEHQRATTSKEEQRATTSEEEQRVTTSEEEQRVTTSEGCAARRSVMSANVTARASPSGGARTKVAATSRARLAADVDVAVMLNGSDLCKIKSRSWKKQRRFQLQDDCLTVQYESRKASKNKCTFSMDDIEAVREGHQSKVLENSSVAPERCFTIVFRGRRNNLDLAAETAAEAQHWMSGLGKLVANMDRMGPQERHDTWIYEWFKKADKNKDERMHLKEVKDLLLMMNIQMNEYHAERLFKWADRSYSGTLEYDEFVEFYQALTQREEVRFLFQRLCHDTNNVLSASKLTSFLQDCQGELDAMKERSTYLINKHEPCEIVRERGCMTFDGFLLYLTSPDGSVFNPTHGSIHQSMKEPLNHYFISSSHNTYLLQDQLRGPSSTEAYIKAFLKGCRCVELDCWDGPNEEPVIYHGYTLTSKILFRDVIQVVEKYAFKVSEYPVILSIENHCSLEQQRVMAHHMKSILKNKLLTEPVQSGESEQPSPEQLKGKVLIKGKKLICVKQPAVDVGFRAAQNGEVGEVSDEDEAAEMEDEDVRCKVKSHGKERHQNLARELSDCIVYCRSVHFPGLGSPRHPWETSSLSEGKANKLLKEGGRELVCHNRQFLMRVYPAARRTDSSNFDPMPYWSAGYQIVALNFQTPGDEMDLHEGWFKQNGSCGLVLKPMCLRSPASRFSPTEPQPGYGLHPVRLKIKVISGQQLPKVANSSKGSIVDPLVRVEIHGVPSDNARLETKYIDNNGFSPQWNESLSFVLTVPELALVRFVVEDHDTASRNDFVAQYTLPFSSLCRGYRHVHLLSQDGTSVAPSSLFVYIHITDLE